MQHKFNIGDTVRTTERYAKELTTLKGIDKGRIVACKTRGATTHHYACSIDELKEIPKGTIIKVPADNVVKVHTSNGGDETWIDPAWLEPWKRSVTLMEGGR